MDELRLFYDDPDSLIDYGFEKRVQHTCYPNRMVWYEKIIQSVETQIKFIIQIEFDLFISDDPGASYTDNLDYSFNGVYIVVFDRQMEKIYNLEYDEETDMPNFIGRKQLNINTLDEVQQLCKLLD